MNGSGGRAGAAKTNSPKNLLKTFFGAGVALERAYQGRKKKSVREGNYVNDCWL